IGGELRRDLATQPEAFNGPALSLRRWPARSGLGSLARVVPDLARQSVGDRRGEAELAAQTLDVLIEQAGHGRRPTELPTAPTNRRQSFRRSAKVAAPALVSE